MRIFNFKAVEWMRTYVVENASLLVVFGLPHYAADLW